jgi:predicted acyl esterase
MCAALLVVIGACNSGDASGNGNGDATATRATPTTAREAATSSSTSTPDAASTTGSAIEAPATVETSRPESTPPATTVPPVHTMVVDKDVEIAVEGLALRANVFRPAEPGEYPVILSLSPYGKDLAFRDAEPATWEALLAAVPDLCEQSSCAWFNWETVDPERWVPHGYVVVRVDARGSGKSPGVLDPFSPQEVDDYARAIEWAGTQPWSNGRVGLVGVSYYAINQWLVASRQPKHLAAIVPWEGAADMYRDISHHGGIYSSLFPVAWWGSNVLPAQHGNAQSTYVDMDDGEPIGGSPPMTADELAANTIHLPTELASRSFDDAWYRERSAVWSKITVPILSAGNWGGLGLHLRGNIEGFRNAASPDKWLEVHGGDHIVPFYSERGVNLQKQFLDHFLNGVDNGWERRAPVTLQVRHADGSFVERAEEAWPLPGTEWTRLHLDAGTAELAPATPVASSKSEFTAGTSDVTFSTPPLEEQLEVTGPLSATVFVSSSTSDADLFVTLRAFAPDGSEVTFEGATEPAVPISQGWLRLSHRAIDVELSSEGRPWHPHAAADPLTPGEIYEVEVEIWPTSIVLPAGYRLALTIGGADFSRDGGNPMTGSGPFLHADPEDRPTEVFGGTTTIHTGPSTPSSLLLPVIEGDRP